MHGRRRFLASLAALGPAACARPSPPPPKVAAAPKPEPEPPKPEPVDHVELLDWEFPSELGGDKRATVLVPRPLPADAPVLVTLHGLGETTSPTSGANGWPKSYALIDTYERLLHPPLDAAAFQGLVAPDRLAEINASLAERPLAGVVVACPYMPKEIGGAVPIELYARWLAERLLPRLRDELGVTKSARATGIDGVSLGGFAGLRIAMERPDLFGAVGALQPAILDPKTIDEMTSLIAEKLGDRPLRIVTSTEDLYRQSLATLDQRLTAKGVAHEFAITPGPHDYPWNKGPGGIEMLLWHDRVLRR